jgi:hypothetical protein
VAAHDRTEGARPGLASYYAEKGETPGVGRVRLAGIEGLAVGDEVTAEQMQLLFGSGHHPLAAQRQDRLEGPGLTEKDYQAVARLGAPYRVHASDVSAFRLEVAQRMEDLAASPGAPPRLPADAEGAGPDPHPGRGGVLHRRARPPPADAREVAATIAKHSRQDHRGGRVRPDVLPGEEHQHPVGGRPRRRSPPRSSWPTTTPSPTRWRSSRSTPCTPAKGTNGVRQVDVTGLVATAFTHRDSRAGDPDLHTHVAVANKVQTVVREVAGHRRAGPVQGQGHRLRDLQHRPGEAPAPGSA